MDCVGLLMKKPFLLIVLGGLIALLTSCSEKSSFRALGEASPPNPDSVTQQSPDTTADSGDDGDGSGGGGDGGDEGGEGEGGDPPERERGMRSANFSGQAIQKQDFLFVIDDSGSMQEEINAVKDNVDEFNSLLQEHRLQVGGVDYQVAITTTDTRRYSGDLLTSSGGLRVISPTSSADPAAEWRSILSSIQVGASPTAYNEQGYRAAELAITRFGSEFSRPGVPLAVVMLSDEDDQSAGPANAANTYGSDGAFYSVQHYADFFKNQANTMLMYPIVGMRSKPCSQVAQYGDRYLSIHTAIGTGAIGSICQDATNTDLVDSFTEIAKVISGRGVCYALPIEATGASFQVSVNGSAVPLATATTQGYAFEQSSNSICFAGDFVLGEGTPIVVEYEAFLN
jgi:hypothetical protein